MTLIKCPNCGKEQENQGVCIECGMKFEEMENHPTQEDISMNTEQEINEDVETKDIPQVEKTENIKIENEDKNKKQEISKRLILEIVGVVALMITIGIAANFNGKYKSLSKQFQSIDKQLAEVREEKKTLMNENSELTIKNQELTEQIDELENGASKQLVDIKNAYEKGEWQTVIDLTAQLHDKYNGSAEDQEAQQMAKTSQENIDKAAAEKAAEEAKGYETGITYDQLARTPDDYFGKKVKFSGKVIQVIEGEDSVQIRLAVNNDYDTILLGEYTTSIVSSRVLEDDQITIYGTSVGTISYKSTMGGQITIPGVYIDKIDQ